MKLLSDFDGVWTYPEAEGVAHGAELEAALLAGVGEGEREAGRDWIARARRALRAEPSLWGWRSAGRISAFADEDPFTEHGALLHYMEVARAHDPLAARLAAVAEAGAGSLDGFGGRAHVAGVQKVEAGRGPGVTPAAAAAGRAMLARDVEVVVVSNSGTEKLGRWFAHANLPFRVHPDRAPRALRLRGSAKKFVLAPGAGETVDAGGLRVDVARPHYEAVLREERPDAVVGDVFSLDLALPLALKRREPEWRSVRLFWLVHPYTPERMRRAIAALPDGEVEAVEGGLAGVAERL
jgi:hypothetical protein